EVADRGVGMSDTELAEVNERLASPAAVDASVSRRMGLFVVGRLAGRHGLGVRLQHGEGGVGVWASVTIPTGLVRAAVERVEPLAAAKPFPSPLTALSAGPATNGSGQGALARALIAGRDGVLVPSAREELTPVAPAADAAPVDERRVQAPAQR